MKLSLSIIFLTISLLVSSYASSICSEEKNIQAMDQLKNLTFPSKEAIFLQRQVSEPKILTSSYEILETVDTCLNDFDEELRLFADNEKFDYLAFEPSKKRISAKYEYIRDLFQKLDVIPFLFKKKYIFTMLLSRVMQEAYARTISAKCSTDPVHKAIAHIFQFRVSVMMMHDIYGDPDTSIHNYAEKVRHLQYRLREFSNTYHHTISRASPAALVTIRNQKQKIVSVLEKLSSEIPFE